MTRPDLVDDLQHPVEVPRTEHIAAKVFWILVLFLVSAVIAILAIICAATVLTWPPT